MNVHAAVRMGYWALKTPAAHTDAGVSSGVRSQRAHRSAVPALALRLKSGSLNASAFPAVCNPRLSQCLDLRTDFYWPSAALTRGITCSAIKTIERRASAGSVQSSPA